VFVNKENYTELDQDERDLIKETHCDVVILDVEDDFEWNNKNLISSLSYQYKIKALVTNKA